MKDPDEKERLASTLRSLVQYEAEQVHRRINWLGTFQGLLFTSLALGWGKNSNLAKLTALLGIIVRCSYLLGYLRGCSPANASASDGGNLDQRVKTQPRFSVTIQTRLVGRCLLHRK